MTDINIKTDGLLPVGSQENTIPASPATGVDGGGRIYQVMGDDDLDGIPFAEILPEFLGDELDLVPFAEIPEGSLPSKKELKMIEREVHKIEHGWDPGYTVGDLLRDCGVDVDKFLNS